MLPWATVGPALGMAARSCSSVPQSGVGRHAVTPRGRKTRAKCKQVSEAPSPSPSVILSVTQQTCLSSCSVPGPVQGEPFLSTSKCSLAGSHTRGPWPKLVCRRACSGRPRPELSGPPNGHHCAGTRGHVPQVGRRPHFSTSPTVPLRLTPAGSLVHAPPASVDFGVCSVCSRAQPRAWGVVEVRGTWFRA